MRKCKSSRLLHILSFKLKKDVVLTMAVHSTEACWKDQLMCINWATFRMEWAKTERQIAHYMLLHFTNFCFAPHVWYMESVSKIKFCALLPMFNAIYGMKRAIFGTNNHVNSMYHSSPMSWKIAHILCHIWHDLCDYTNEKKTLFAVQ